MADPDTIYQLRITLKAIRPPIWRRVQVPGAMTLPRLHRVIQVPMGWTDSHLHEFVVRGRHFGQAFSEWGPSGVVSERSVRLDDVLFGPKMRLTYVYDFGDGWQHDVLVKRVLVSEPGVHYPWCLGGARACPPEDCGSFPGYVEFLEAIRDPKHPRHAELLGWAGGHFDPEAFDVEAVNRRLKRFRWHGRRAGA